jgi:hypothetical protein
MCILAENISNSAYIELIFQMFLFYVNAKENHPIICMFIQIFLRFFRTTGKKFNVSYFILVVRSLLICWHILCICNY